MLLFNLIEWAVLNGKYHFNTSNVTIQQHHGIQKVWGY